MPLEAKLEIGRFDDPLERDADRVAEQALTMPVPSAALGPTDTALHPDGAWRENERRSGSLRRKGAPIAPVPGAGKAPASVHEVLGRSGAPLDATTRAFMEPRFAHDFSHVRVHADGVAAQSAAAIGAAAYSVGPHIVFGAGRYAPATGTGRRLLAHELAHVLQGGADGALRRAPLPDESQPRPIIIAYGTGQVNPTSNQHNVGSLFKKVAAQKLAETKARLGKNTSKHTFVFEYAPTEAELKAVLNKKYGAPVAEVHIFSHGWSEGANLGGPAPPTGTKRPTTEAPEDAEERRLVLDCSRDP